MLGVLFNGNPESVDESIGFAQALMKEGLKSLPADKDISLGFYLILMLLPAEQGGILQENSYKQNLVLAYGTGGGKVILALPEEILTPQVSPNPINVRKPSF